MTSSIFRPSSFVWSGPVLVPSKSTPTLKPIAFNNFFNTSARPQFQAEPEKAFDFSDLSQSLPVITSTPTITPASPIVIPTVDKDGFKLTENEKQKLRKKKKRAQRKESQSPAADGKTVEAGTLGGHAVTRINPVATEKTVEKPVEKTARQLEQQARLRQINADQKLRKYRNSALGRLQLCAAQAHKNTGESKFGELEALCIKLAELTEKTPQELFDQFSIPKQRPESKKTIVARAREAKKQKDDPKWIEAVEFTDAKGTKFNPSRDLSKKHIRDAFLYQDTQRALARLNGSYRDANSKVAKEHLKEAQRKIKELAKAIGRNSTDLFDQLAPWYKEDLNGDLVL